MMGCVRIHGFMGGDGWVGGVNYDTLHTDAPAVMVMMVMVE